MKFKEKAMTIAGRKGGILIVKTWRICRIYAKRLLCDHIAKISHQYWDCIGDSIPT
jgi:hypothetical protein